jgi:hypothetical protein
LIITRRVKTTFKIAVRTDFETRPVKQVKKHCFYFAYNYCYGYKGNNGYLLIHLLNAWITWIHDVITVFDIAHRYGLMKHISEGLECLP